MQFHSRIRVANSRYSCTKRAFPGYKTTLPIDKQNDTNVTCSMRKFSQFKNRVGETCIQSGWKKTSGRRRRKIARETNEEILVENCSSVVCFSDFQFLKSIRLAVIQIFRFLDFSLALRTSPLFHSPNRVTALVFARACRIFGQGRGRFFAPENLQHFSF